MNADELMSMLHVRVSPHGIHADLFDGTGCRCFQLVGHRRWVEYPEGGLVPYPTNPDAGKPAPDTETN